MKKNTITIEGHDAVPRIAFSPAPQRKYLGQLTHPRIADSRSPLKGKAWSPGSGCPRNRVFAPARTHGVQNSVHASRVARKSHPAGGGIHGSMDP